MVSITLFCPMILSKKSATFWDHALARREGIVLAIPAWPAEAQMTLISNRLVQAPALIMDINKTGSDKPLPARAR